jgi:hypothetical protein
LPEIGGDAENAGTIRSGLEVTLAHQSGDKDDYRDDGKNEGPVFHADVEKQMLGTQFEFLS